MGTLSTNVPSLDALVPQDIQMSIDLADSYISKYYLSSLTDEACVVYQRHQELRKARQLRLMHIERIVPGNKSTINTRLTNVYQSVSKNVKRHSGISLFMVIRGHDGVADLYLGIRDLNNPAVTFRQLVSAVKGNFPGITFSTEYQTDEIEKIIGGGLTTDGSILDINRPQKFGSVSAVSLVPSQKDSDEEYSQGIEKFIDAMSAAKSTYTAIIIASPLSQDTVRTRRKGLEDISTQLSRFSEITMQISGSRSVTETQSTAHSFSDAICNGVATSISTGTNYGSSSTIGNQRGTNFGFSIDDWHWGFSDGYSITHGSYSGGNRGYQQTDSRNITHQAGKTTGKGTTKGQETGISVTFKQINKTVTELMRKIDIQLKRIEQGEAFDLWNCAAYFIAPDEDTARHASSTFSSFVSGSVSGIEGVHVNTWVPSSQTLVKSTYRVLESLRYGLHPNILVNGNEENPLISNPTCMISGVELPIIMGLPYNEVAGVAVTPMAEFGRQIQYNSGQRAPKDCVIEIGNIFHMGTRSSDPVRLSLNAFNAHTFITGTPRVGKSNATFIILEQLIKNRVNFLVVEPVKGEYKEYFGHRNDVSVYTAHPRVGIQLRLNPFECGENVLISSHIDTLYEFLCSCWPLYGPQSAILKKALDMAYQMCGWDITNCVFRGKGFVRYPDFDLLYRCVYKLIDEGEYSAQGRGDLIGSLGAKITAYTSGILGSMMNCDCGLSDELLFDRNVIIDLSDLGGAGGNDAKMLIMGALVIRMYEHLHKRGLSKNLRHVTILEEAHNLLKPDTNTHVAIDDAGIGIVSSSMISSMIAEVGGYGEGFILVDQSPSKIDRSAISHTSTKIIFNLPGEDDRNAAAGSFSSTDEQAEEIAKLPIGVAVVNQRGWIEPVLVSVNEFTGQKKERPMCSNDDIRRMSTVFVYETSLAFEHSSVRHINTIISQMKKHSRSKDKTDEYIRMIKEYQRRIAKVSESDPHYAYECSMLLGEMFVSVLSCGEVYSQYPIPVAGKNGNFADQCRKWKENAVSFLDGYFDNNAIDGKVSADTVAKLLLRAKMRLDDNAIKVYKALFSKGE